MEDKHNSLRTLIAFLLGLISLVLAMLEMVIPSLVGGIVTIILGFIQTKKEKSKEKDIQTNMAVWSLILGVAVVLIVVLFYILGL